MLNNIGPKSKLWGTPLVFLAHSISTVVIFTRGQFWLSGIVVWVCVCVSLCVNYPCDNSGPVPVKITKFGPKVQNALVKVFIILWSDRPWGSRPSLTYKSKFTPFWAFPHHNSSSPIQAIGSTNLDQTVCQSLACPRDNSGPVQARITRFGPKVQNTLGCGVL